MRNGLLQKGLVSGITLLFIVATFVPSINGSQSPLEKNVIKSQNQITFKNTNFNNDFNIPKPLNLLDGLVGYWNFNEGSGDILHDSSIYGNHGTIYGDPTWTPGILGNALIFDGTDDWIDCGNDSSLSPLTAITLFAWYKPTSSWMGAGNEPIIDKTDSNDQAFAYQYHLGVCGDLFDESNDLRVNFDITSGGISRETSAPSNTLSFNNWSFIVGTYDGSTMKLFIDNVLISSILVSGALTNYGSNLRIAKYIISNGTEKFLPGIIDEVRIYNRALTDYEIHELFLQESLVGYWNFEEGNGNILHDSTNNHYDGTILGANWTTSIFGNGLYFDGVDDIVAFTTPVLNTAPYTISIWIKPFSITDSQQYTIFSNGGDFSEAYGFSLFLYPSEANNNWYFSVSNPNGDRGGVIIPATSTNWTFLVGTWDGSTGTDSIKFYINGNLEGTATPNNSPYECYPPNLIIGNSRHPEAENFVKGIIDEAGIYNRILTQQEIHDLYTPSIVYIDDDFTSSTQGWGYNHFSSIQAGIDTVDFNGTIFVSNGTYVENLVIEKNYLKILGENKNSTVIDANGVGNVITIQNQLNNEYNGKYNFFSGFTLRNAGGDGVYIHDVGRHGPPHPALNTISDCSINNCLGSGIHLYSDHEGMPSNSFLNCNIFNNSGYGVYFHGRYQNADVISGCKIFNNQQGGILFEGSAYNWGYSGQHIVRNNSIYNNNGAGLSITADNFGNIIYHNNFYNNTQNAYDYGSDALWYNATIQQGNYWSDYTGSDANGDGIGDTPFNINGGDRQDLYPFMQFNGWRLNPGSLIAWGWNDNNQCNIPPPNNGFIAVSGGGYFSLGLKTNGSVVAWGYNGYGECNVPSPNTGFIAISAGWDHCLGLKTNGSVVAWGRNAFGACNVPSPNTGFIAIAAGESFSLGLKVNGSIVAWGANYNGQCNLPSPNNGFIAISANNMHGLGLKADGSIVAWGTNWYGECNIPSPNTGFIAISAGAWHNLGLKADGSIVAWGYNNGGACNIPEPNSDFIAVATGGFYSLGLKDNSSIISWGENNYGVCNIPLPNSGFITISAGYCHSLGLKAEIPLMAVYIDDNFNSSTLGWGYDHFSSIQDGIDAVDVGGIVFIYNGTYNESLEPDNEYVRIEKSITLKGENKISTIINCPAGETGIMISTTWTGVKNVNISGFTVQGTNQIAVGIYANPYCTNLTIENCIVHSFSEGISCRIGAKNVTIKNCISFNNNREGGICFLETGYQNISISNCISYNNNGCGIDIKNCNYGIGILSNNSCFNNVEDGIYLRSSNFFSISNCTSYSNGQSGLQIYNRYKDGDSGAENNIVQNSTFYNNSWHGISIYGWGNFQNNDIINCDCIENDLYGIAIDGGFVAGSQILNCTSSFNGMDGIILNCEGQDMQLVKNICSNNSGSGITICGNQNLVKKNIVTDNNGYGIIFRNHTAFENPPCNNIIYYNNLINNYQNAYDNGSNFWYNNNSQEGNYYDDYTGQDNDADAIGDMPYSIAGGVNQDFYPLMTPFGPPHANFTSINNDKIVTFDASVSYDYDGSIISYEWDFGDGTNATGIYINHSFSQYETYNVTLTVFDNDGKQDSLTEPVAISDLLPPEIIDNTLSIAYTGDPFTFNATITDNDAVDVAFVHFHYNTGDMIVAPLTNTNGDYWEVTVIIENVLGFMGYYIATSDVSGNFYSTEPISILIIDNDFPSFTDNSPSSGTTGDLYTFDITASDNLGISCIMASWDHGYQSGFNIPLNNDDDGTWSLPITLDQDLNPLLYNITVIDISNNIMIGPQQTIPIMDNDFPMVVDNTPSIGYAGQYFTFNATATDNIDVSIVHVEYWFDNGTHSSVNLENVAGDYYQGTTFNTMPLSCVILHYIITVEDTSGNSVSTGNISVIIIPDIQPTAPIINGPTSGNTGEIYTYTFVAIDPDNDNIYYEVNWGDGQVDDWYGPCTSNIVITRTHQWAEKGTYLIQARAKDIYGAIGEWGSLSITMPTEIVVQYQSLYQITSFQLKKIMS
jgi:nitrous oxidase accessory protein NosD